MYRRYGELTYESSSYFTSSRALSFDTTISAPPAASQQALRTIRSFGSYIYITTASGQRTLTTVYRPNMTCKKGRVKAQRPNARRMNLLDYGDVSQQLSRTTKPILLSPSERESSAESSYDEEPAPSVKRRKTTTEPSAKLTFSLPTPAKKPPTELAITKTGKAVLEKYDAQALTAKQAADMVAYTRQLEEKAGGKKLTDSEMQEQLCNLRVMIKRGIEKQLTVRVLHSVWGKELMYSQWKASCARNATKYSFEGMCANPAVIAAMRKVSDVTKFKQKKYVV